MQFEIKRDILLRSLNYVQGVVEKKNTLPILSNVLLELKGKKLSIVATDLDIIFYDEINDVKILKEGSTTTSAAILYDILRKISSNSELNFVLKSEDVIYIDPIKNVRMRSSNAQIYISAISSIALVANIVFGILNSN